MVDERESPSGGWREVYHEMEVPTDVEEPTHPCPDCGRSCTNVLRDVYECEDHGVFRAPTDNSGSETSHADGDDADETDAPDPDRLDERRNPTGKSTRTA
ncbi:hypothetical protein [Halorussus salinisoli]|uniref:hypothetical protein n=1 Tax=Halorussus salinisoli TaxID=2558242 RepID=UPI0010C17D3D|nr:hypothetical protein [Halorussus salinisoli]